MAISRTHRVPVLLLSLLVGTLLFPRACDETRLTVASLLPGTVRPEQAEPARLPEEERTRIKSEVDQLQQELASRPAGDGVLSGIRYVPHGLGAEPVAIACRVLHRETSSARRSLLVDRGRDHGVEPGMPVVQQDSLIGVVATASAGAARVLRIDDRAAATTFPATVLAGDAGSGSPLRGQGVARGMGDGRIRVSFLPTGGARIGDLVVTGAGSRLVPEGLVLGEVEEVSDEERDGAFEAMVRPLRDLDAVASVHALRIAAPGLRVEGK